MNISKPNRMRAQSADHHETQQKASGDQHILPLDDSDDAPHRPHRLNRQDMNKTSNARPYDPTEEES
jgi:hypothetical protein